MVIAASERRDKERMAESWGGDQQVAGLHIRFCCEALARPLHILGDSISIHKWDRSQKVELPSIRSYLFQLGEMQRG